MLKDQKYYESLDKRTKEYREYANRSKGLGDDVKKVLDKTGVSKVVKKFKNGKDCGCDKRQKKLNKMLPRSAKAVRCMDEKQYNDYKKYVENRTLNIWKRDEIKFLLGLYRWVFATNYNESDLCPSCTGSAKILLKITNNLDQVYQSYNSN